VSWYLVFNTVPTLVTMLWRGVFAADSCNPKHDFSHTCSSSSPPTPTLHIQKAHTRPIPRNYTTKITLEPQDMKLYTGRKTPHFRRNLLPPPSHLYCHFFLTCETLFYPKTVSTSLPIGSLNFWNLDVPWKCLWPKGNHFFKYVVQKTNTTGITLNHNTRVPIHGILE